MSSPRYGNSTCHLTLDVPSDSDREELLDHRFDDNLAFLDVTHSVDILTFCQMAIAVFGVLALGTVLVTIVVIDHHHSRTSTTYLVEDGSEPRVCSVHNVLKSSRRAQVFRNCVLTYRDLEVFINTMRVFRKDVV